MAKLKIIWSHEAVNQIRYIFNFYNERNGSNKYSKTLQRMIKDSLKLIAVYPYMYPKTTYYDTRYFCCEYFKVFYSVHPRFIAIEAVFDTRQNPEKAPYQ